MSKSMPKLFYGQDMHSCWSEGNQIAEKLAIWWFHRAIERRLSTLEGCVGKLEITVGKLAQLLSRLTDSTGNSSSSGKKRSE